MTISGFPKVDNTTPDLGCPQVDPVTGELTLRVIDLGHYDLGETFFVERAYVPGRIKDGRSKDQSLGSRWMLDFDGRLARNGANLRLPIGAFRWEAFCFQDNMWVHNKNAERYQLREKRDGFQLRDFTIPAEYIYDTNGHLTSVKKKGGLPRSINYYGDIPVGITLCGGSEITLKYEGTLLTLVKDCENRCLYYEYEDNLLKKVVYANNAAVHYEYDDMGRLTSCTDHIGKLRFSIAYDFYGRVSRLELGNGDVYTYRYVDQDRRMILLSENTMEFRTYYWNFKNQVVRVIYEEGEEEQFSYDEAGRVVYHMHASGKEVRSSYNEKGLVIKEACSDGMTVEYEYDDLGRIVRMHDNFDGEEQYTWNKNGWLVEKRTRLTGHAWRKEQWERDMLGRIIAYSCNGNVISYVYEGNMDRPRIMETPCGDRFSYKYDSQGRLLSIQSELGGRYFGYNVLDLVARDIDSLGNHHVYMYDLQGELLEGEPAPAQLFPGSIKEQRMLPSMGDVYGANSEFLCSYDSKGRLTEVRRREDETLVALFRYDIGGRIIEERVAEESAKGKPMSLRLRRWKYDNDDNIVEERRWIELQDETGTRGRIYILRHEYDACGRRVLSEDNEDVRHEYEYNSLNCCTMRKRREKNKLVELVKYIYDAAGRLTGRDLKSDYARTGKLWEHTEYTLDEDGQCWKALYPDGTEEVGEKAKASYEVCLADFPHYNDISGYAKTQYKR
ncbi:MAG: RHS repeat protein [Selenomonadaceae bacterium]|nr:RHS repeat protein [Selenomonadaceae bacterium]